MKTQEKLNMTMLCDFYELTMGNGYFEAGCKERITYFDVFFRKVPDGGGFAIAAGLEQLIDYRSFSISRSNCSFHRHCGHALAHGNGAIMRWVYFMILFLRRMFSSLASKLQGAELKRKRLRLRLIVVAWEFFMG